MLRARHVSSNSLRSPGWLAVRRRFSGSSVRKAAEEVQSEQDGLGGLANDPQSSTATLDSLGDATAPSVFFTQAQETQSFEWGSLRTEIPLPYKRRDTSGPPHRLVSDGMRKRKGSHRAFGIPRDPTPRLFPVEHGAVKGTHGLLSPFDTPPLQEVAVRRRAPKIRHNLERVLTNPGVHWLTDPRTGNDNFPAYLKEVPNASSFAFERLTGFVTSSRDSELLRLARVYGCKFAGSTSSLTGMLSLIYLLIAEEKPVDLSTLSAYYQDEPKTFTPGQRMPVSVTLRYKDGVYATDSHVEHMVQLGATETVLSQLGTVMEKFFTMHMHKFKSAYLKSEPVSIEQRPPWEEAYRYAMHNKFLMRSQLDCYSSRLPGSGVFDIKTRAAVPVRYDLRRYRDNLQEYRIRTIQGSWMSFEKEYYDLIRSAFLKYSFQARIGNMDGVFVAYHNTHEIFGFQYIPLEEMDQRLYGHDQGQRIFGKCVGVLDVLFTEITKYFPEQSVNCTLETSTKANVMHIWIEPADWEGPERPIVQLDVRLRHYLGRERVSGSEAVGSRSGGWTIAYSIWESERPRHVILRRRRSAFQTQMRIFKFNLSANERVERKEDVDPSHLDPLADADDAGAPDDLQHPPERAQVSAAQEHGEDSKPWSSDNDLIPLLQRMISKTGSTDGSTAESHSEEPASATSSEDAASGTAPTEEAPPDSSSASPDSTATKSSPKSSDDDERS